MALHSPGLPRLPRSANQPAFTNSPRLPDIMRRGDYTAVATVVKGVLNACHVTPDERRSALRAGCAPRVHRVAPLARHWSSGQCRSLSAIKTPRTPPSQLVVICHNYRSGHAQPLVYSPSRDVRPSAMSNSLRSGISIAEIVKPNVPAITSSGMSGSVDSSDPGRAIRTFMTV